MRQSMKLFYAEPSPFARKVRVLIRELGLDDAVEEIAVHTTPIAPSDEVTAKNPLSKIPTLVTGEDESLYDSRVILAYLASLKPDGELLEPPASERWRAMRRHALADGILGAGILHRYELVIRPEQLRWPQWLDAQKGKIIRALDALQNDPPQAGPQIGVDAIAVACMLAWLDFRMPDITWRASAPALSAFWDEMSIRRSIVETVPKA